MRTITVAAATIELQDGEHYAGLMLDDVGMPSHHLVLMPEADARMPWQAAVEWAEAQGGALPTRREQSLLFANLREQFQPAWYWSSEAHDEDGSSAWLQHFGYGQGYGHKSYDGRARAVRLIPLTT